MEIIAAFEQNSGKEVELVLRPQEELEADLMAAVEAGRRSPDFVFSVINIRHYEQWAYEGRLVDLTDAIGHFSDLFDRDALDSITLLDATTGRRGLYLLPMGFATHHVHAWKSLFERAGFALADIPREWETFHCLDERATSDEHCDPIRTQALGPTSDPRSRQRASRHRRMRQIRPVRRNARARKSSRQPRFRA
jgi:ABC-type glycerol-3-phosphate transport system substrate-binding protein